MVAQTKAGSKQNTYQNITHIYDKESDTHEFLLRTYESVADEDVEDSLVEEKVLCKDVSILSALLAAIKECPDKELWKDAWLDHTFSEGGMRARVLFYAACHVTSVWAHSDAPTFTTDTIRKILSSDAEWLPSYFKGPFPNEILWIIGDEFPDVESLRLNDPGYWRRKVYEIYNYAESDKVKLAALALLKPGVK
jgi:hypothetical protein